MRVLPLSAEIAALTADETLTALDGLALLRAATTDPDDAELAEALQRKLTAALTRAPAWGDPPCPT